MKTLLRHTEYLLQTHDCVILPGLGAVLCHYESAHLDNEGERFVAPHRVLSFNTELDRTDGLLASSIARADRISLSAATIKVTSAVNTLSHTLYEAGHVSLGRIGSLHTTPHGTIDFEAGADEAALSPSCRWLPTLDVTPLQTASQIAREADDEVIKPASRIGAIVRRASAAAASVAAILALTWVVKTTLPNADGGEQFASLAPTVSTTVVETPGTSASSLVLIIKPQTDGVIDVAEDNAATHAVVAQPQDIRMSPDDNYFLIVASCSSIEEARRFIAKNSEYNLGILQSGDRYRIYAASGSSYNHALAGRTETLAERFPEVWVCRR